MRVWFFIFFFNIYEFFSIENHFRVEVVVENDCVEKSTYSWSIHEKLSVMLIEQVIDMIFVS